MEALFQLWYFEYHNSLLVIYCPRRKTWKMLMIIITDYEKQLKGPQNTEWKFITSRRTKLLFFYVR